MTTVLPDNHIAASGFLTTIPCRLLTRACKLLEISAQYLAPYTCPCKNICALF